MLHKIIIISGPPGAGEDTVAKALAKTMDSIAIINVDNVLNCESAGT